MKVIIINTFCSDTLSYVGGLVSVSAGSTLEVPAGLLVRLYADLDFLTNLRNSNIILSDGVTTYRYPQTEDFIRDAIDRINFTSIKKDFSYSSSQTGTILWTPTSNKKFVITDYAINIRNNTLGVITLTIFDETNSSGNILYKANFEAGTNYDNVCNFVTPFISSAINNKLKITTSGSLMVSGSISGYETE